MNKRAGPHMPPASTAIQSREACVLTSLGADGIFQIDYSRCSVLTLDQAQAAHAEHRRVCRGRPTPVVLVGGHIGRVEYRAQRFASEPSVCAITTAVAIVVSSFLERHLSRLFLMYHRPPYPVQVFSDLASARHWLLNSFPGLSPESK